MMHRVKFMDWVKALPRAFRKSTEPRYIPLVLGAPTPNEQDEAAYYAAYLLFRAGIRMRLTIRTLQPRTLSTDQGLSAPVAPIIGQRSRYTTEALQAYPMASFDDFKRHTPFRQGWQVTKALWVHPEDHEAAVLLLQQEGMTIKSGNVMHHSPSN